VYGLLPPGLNGEAPFLTSVEELAARYISEIKTKQPAGPYFLAGYSFGGLVTFEIARQLTVQGDTVGLLALLDTAESQYIDRRTRALKAQHRLGRYRDVLWTILWTPQRLEYLTDRLRRRGTGLVYSLCKRLGRQLPQKIGTIEDVNIFAAAQYVPRPYDGRVTIFSIRQALHTAVDDQTLGWGQFAIGGVDIHEIPGDHDDITYGSNVLVLAHKLSSCLERAQQGYGRPARQSMQTLVASGDLRSSSAGQSACVRPAAMKD
jgi:thioesterase domain-containing protein